MNFNFNEWRNVGGFNFFNKYKPLVDTFLTF